MAEVQREHENTRARRVAVQLLYTGEIMGSTATSIAEDEDVLIDDGVLPDYALRLVRGVDAHRALIDKQISATSENWALARMPLVDRSILRLAAFEMMFVDEVPVSVSINEAVELAKKYGGEEESHRFVNGVLGRIARQLAGEEAPQQDAATAGEEPAEGATAPETAADETREEPNEGAPFPEASAEDAQP